jgi:probable rRNA maturation factor
MRHLPELSLSLQFAKLPDAARHRAALPRHRVVRYLRHALPFDAEMTVRIVDEDEGRALNLSYRKKDYATNVLTFDYTRPPQSPLLLADLVLCAPVVAREAKEQGKTLAAHYAHLLVHGALHAAGYDHETNERDALEMEALEIWLLDVLGFKNPY